MSESPSNSSIKKLLDYLEQTGLLERLQLSDEDVADSIWLALQMGVEDLQSTPIFPENKQPIDSSTSNQIEENLENIPEDNLSKSQPNVDVITEESLPKEIEKPTPIQAFLFKFLLLLHYRQHSRLVALCVLSWEKFPQQLKLF